MLFTGKEILPRFEKYLERATRICIATAWATPGSALNGLEAAVQKKEKKGKKGLKVCAIVGTHGNATDPAALERLKELGKLRLAGNEALFHPKIYVFEFRSGKPVAWVGSANFTRAGFENRNVETVYETKDVNPSLEWFEQQWGQSKRASQKAIDDYRERRRRNPPSREFRKVVGEPEGVTPELLLPTEAQTWKWKPVKRREVRGAFDQMRATLIDGAEVFRNRMVGGSRLTVYWHDDLGYWCAFRKPSPPPREYWNAFGTENPKEADHLGNGCLQINHGHDQHGPFVRNDHGDIFLARDLKRITRVDDEEDLERGLNERLPGSVFDVPWRERPQPRRMVILSEVGSGALRHTVAELVRLVAELGAAED